MILSSATLPHKNEINDVISSFWNADGKGATFLITAIMVSVVFSGMASLAAKKDTEVKKIPLYCSIGMFSSNKFLTNDTQSILMGYTMGYIMSCLVSVWLSPVPFSTYLFEQI